MTKHQRAERIAQIDDQLNQLRREFRDATLEGEKYDFHDEAAGLELEILVLEQERDELTDGN